jgi:hypothetical protein
MAFPGIMNVQHHGLHGHSQQIWQVAEHAAPGKKIVNSQYMQ